MFSIRILMKKVSPSRIPFSLPSKSIYLRHFHGLKSVFSENINLSFNFQKTRNVPSFFSEIKRRKLLQNETTILKSIQWHFQSLIYFSQTTELSRKEKNYKIQQLFQQIEKANNKEQFDEGLKYCEEILKLDPLNKFAWYNKGMFYFSQNKIEESLQAFDEMIKINPRDSLSWTSKAMILQETQRFQDAIQCFDNYLALNPQDVDAWNLKAKVFLEEEKFENAIECYDNALKVSPKTVEILYNKGFVLAEMSKNEQAMECYELALKWQPNFREAWFSKAELFEKMGKVSDAITTYEKLLKLDPNFEDTKQKIKKLKSKIN